MFRRWCCCNSRFLSNRIMMLLRGEDSLTDSVVPHSKSGSTRTAVLSWPCWCRSFRQRQLLSTLSSHGHHPLEQQDIQDRPFGWTPRNIGVLIGSCLVSTWLWLSSLSGFIYDVMAGGTTAPQRRQPQARQRLFAGHRQAVQNERRLHACRSFGRLCMCGHAPSGLPALFFLTAAVSSIAVSCVPAAASECAARSCSA